MILKQVFLETYTKLKIPHVEHPHLESSWIIESICGISDVERIQHPDREISDPEISKINQAISRRSEGEPLAYILGVREFYGLQFKVNNQVLIPRPETELLVDWSLSWIEKQKKDQIRIADLGTGSGCIGLTLLAKFSGAHLVAIDKSEKALAVAKENAQRLGVAGRANFFHADVSEWLLKHCDPKYQAHMQFDLIVANPPYIDPDDTRIDANVKKYEPHEALFSSDHGLHHIKKWLNSAPLLLAPGGAIAFEVGSGQGESVKAFMRDLRVFSEHYLIRDYNEHDRVVCAVKPS